MTEKEVGRYLELIDRRLYILNHSGIDWQPEYGPELDSINRKLTERREAVEAEHARRKERKA